VRQEDATYDALVNTDFCGAKGVVANIPYVNTLPFFTIATNPVPLNAVQVAQLNCYLEQ
jgi:hypothetical protein